MPGHSGNQYTNQYASRSHSRPWHDQYALEELDSNEEGKRSDEVHFAGRAPNYSATAAFSNGSGSEENGSRNEEVSLDRPPQPDKTKGMGGIVLTTEVIVH